MTLRLRTFGTTCIERDGQPLGGVHTQRRRLALLAYLAASGRSPVTRDKLIALLWPGRNDESGRHSLSQLLYTIKHDLGAGLLAVEQDIVTLNFDILESDVDSFQTALRGSHLECAIEKYHGAFLDGFHIDDAPEMERWIDSERMRLEGLCSRALEKLAAQAESGADLHRAVELWRRRSAIDPADGRVTLRLMKALASVGDRRGALNAARIHETLVRDEFDGEPDGAVTGLAEELRLTISSTATAPSTVPIPDRMMVADSVIVDRTQLTQESIDPRETRVAPLRWRWLALGAGVLGVALAASAWGRLQTHGSQPLAPGNEALVVIGDLTGPDSLLSLAVREALRAELANQPGLSVTSDLGLRELKSLMRLPQDSELTVPQLLAVATRGGANAAIAGSVMPVGDGAQIVIDIFDPRNGDIKQTLAERAAEGNTILVSAERMGRKLREMISRQPRDRNALALPRVTTSSLPALKSYALARQIASRGAWHEALAHGERAVIHDTSFVLAHYLLGDILWFLDEQSHSDAHLAKAHGLSGSAPLKEQLMIRARYEQLVRDRPDRSLVYWDLLRDAAPRDAMAYEGRAWALRALGRHREAAAAADSAMSIDPAAVAPNTNNAMYSWLAIGDTANALAVADRVAGRNPEARLEAAFFSALYRRDHFGALELAGKSRFQSSRTWRRHLAHLVRGDLAAAMANLDTIKMLNPAQTLPRALTNQGWIEMSVTGDREAAARYARETLEWLAKRDLSPPAVARIAERTAVLAARAGDEKTVAAVIVLVDKRDRGRSLRSYVLARRTLDAALAYAQGDFELAAERAERARQGVYFWRSLATVMQLGADAWRSAGDVSKADSLERIIEGHQVVDGDFETWLAIRPAGGRRIATGHFRAR